MARGKRVLSYEQVRLIRRRYPRGRRIPYKVTAEELGVDVNVVKGVVYGQTYKNVTDILSSEQRDIAHAHRE